MKGLQEDLSEDEITATLSADKRALLNQITATLSVDKRTLLNQSCRPKTWSRVILFLHTQAGSGRIFAALPSQPYLAHVQLTCAQESTTKEADVPGPFPFQYHMTTAKL